MMKIPTFDELIWPTLKALKALGGSGTNKEILNKIVELEEYSDEVQSILHNGKQPKIDYNSAWARSYLRMYDAIDNPKRGTWVLLNKGEDLTEEKALKIPEYVRKKYNKNKNSEIKGIEERNIESLDDWKANLKEILLKINPYDFEKLCQLLLRSSGFSAVEVTSKSGDGGIDGNGLLRVNLISFHVAFQCKRYAKNVGAPDIRDFRGAFIGRADKGIFITTGNFTAEARRESIRDGAPAIDLIDGDDLCELLKENKLGVKTQLVEEVEIDYNWFDKI